MIFGDSASGKSSFAEQLASRFDVPLLHLDMIMDELGRADKASISQFIRDEANKEHWIIEGNAFTKDPEFRIKQADIIFIFDYNRFVTLKNHVVRYFKIRFGKEKRKGSRDIKLNLSYFLPYILYKFPPRKRAAKKLALSLGKEVIVFKRYRDVEKHLHSQ